MVCGTVILQTQVLAPGTGSRQGDRNADVLFSFVLAKLLQEIRQRAADEGLVLTEDTAFGPVRRHLSWLDDPTFAVTSDAKHLIQKVTRLFSLTIDVATTHALQLSLEPGKTAVIMGVSGQQSTERKTEN